MNLSKQMLKEHVLVLCGINQWSGKTRLTSEEAGQLGIASPQGFSELGNKCLVDPAHLRIFDRIRDKRDSLLDSVGEKFGGPYIISIKDLADTKKKLDDIEEEFKTAKADFLRNFETLNSRWALLAKEKGEEIISRFIINACPDVEYVQTRFDFATSVVNCEGPTEEMNQLLEKKLGSLGEKIMHDICADAKDFYHTRLFNKESANKRSKAILVGWHKKLASLIYLNSRFRPMIGLLEEAIRAYDTCTGTLQGKNLHTVMAAVLMLSSPKTIDGFSSGDLAVADIADQSWSQSTNQMSLPTSEAPVDSPILIQPEPFMLPPKAFDLGSQVLSF